MPDVPSRRAFSPVQTAWGALSLSLVSSLASAASIPVLALSPSGETLESSVDASEFEATLVHTLENIADSMPHLSAEPPAKQASEWKLRTIVVGIGTSAEVGLGDLWKLKISPRFRAIFSESNDPVMP